MEELFYKINHRYKNQEFINNPNILEDYSIDVIFYKKLTDETPNISIVTPVYNQEKIIVSNIKSVLENTLESKYEYILIIDCCSDNTMKEIIEFFLLLETYPNNCVLITVLKSNIPLFETSADNLGFYCSRGDYIIEVQADMKMTEKGYNEVLMKPFKSIELYDEDDNSKVIGVSGRCCHKFNGQNGIGKLGYDVEKTVEQLGIERNIFYISETCNRGPLAIDRKKLIELKYLDEKNFYLDDSDHDLFARAYFYKKWICGYVPIDFSSPIQEGSTRKARDSINEKWLKIRKEQSNGGFYNKYLKYLYEPRSNISIKL
jgi:glycosyltransferase involved in cell wall biosynthesis